MSEEKKDLTRIEDLSDFIHQEDDEVNEILRDKSKDSNTPPLPSLDDLQDEEEEDFPPEFSFEEEESLNDDSNEAETLSTEETNEDLSFTESSNTEIENEDDEEAFNFDFTDNDQSFEEEDSEDSEDSEEDNNETDFSTEDDETETDFSTEDDETETDFSSEDDETETEFSSEDDETEFSSEDDQTETDFSSEVDQTETDFSSEVDETETEFSSEDDNFEAERFTDENNADSPTSFVEEKVETPADVITTSSSPPRETFDDVKKFGNSITYGNVAQGGNPPYSFILKNIKFEEDVEDILILLREHGLCNEQNEEIMRQGLENGALLVSQISEYSAIYLAHKLRRFDLEIQLGLSEEIHSSKSYDKTSFGLISKSSMKQNKSQSMNFEEAPVELDSILIATTSLLEGYDIQRYLGIITDSTIINHEDIERYEFASKSAKEESDDQEEHDFLQNFSLGLNEIHADLSNRLKEQALTMNANAIVGINFQMSPLIESETMNQPKYKLTCTGNAVWVTGN